MNYGFRYFFKKKIIVVDYDFNFKKFKIVVNNYSFDDMYVYVVEPHEPLIKITLKMSSIKMSLKV